MATFFLLKRFSEKNIEKSTDKHDSTVNPIDSPRQGKTGQKVDGNVKEKSRSFDYTPEMPVNGTLRGVVEVGATGFNAFVIEMDKQKRWKMISKDFGRSLAYENLATTDDIRIGLKKFFSTMFDQGVLSRNMHFVISSGAQREPKTLVISNELKKMGYIVNLVTAEQEGKFALRATVPLPYQQNSFLVDIGSGTTKISWEEDDRLRALGADGSKYYEHGRSDADVYDEVKGQAAHVPGKKTNTCFIIGGVPYSLSLQSRASPEERYTILDNPGRYKAADKKMACGLNIYKAVADATGCNNFVFDADANFTIGFLLSLRERE